MPQPITPLYTHREIDAFRVDLTTETIALSCTEGTEDETGTYQPARSYERVIEGDAFAALASTVITIQTPHQTEPITVRELIKRLLYPFVV